MINWSVAEGSRLWLDHMTAELMSDAGQSQCILISGRSV